MKRCIQGGQTSESGFLPTTPWGRPSLRCSSDLRSAADTDTPQQICLKVTLSCRTLGMYSFIPIVTMSSKSDESE